MRRQVDELSKEELGKVWEACQFHWVRAGRLLFPERPKGYARAAKDIGHYAINKLVAIRLAEEGSREASQKYSKICASIWAGLPPWARSVELEEVIHG